jgi:hypothetical protein
VAKAAAGKKEAAADTIGSRIPPNTRRSHDNVVHKVDVAHVAITIHICFKCMF